MARCSDKRFSAGGLNVPSGSRCVINGEATVVVSGRRKPREGEVHIKALREMVAAGDSVLLDVPVAGVPTGPNTPFISLTPEMLERPQGSEAMMTTLELMSAEISSETLAAVANEQLRSLHLKSNGGSSAGRARSSVKVLEKFLPSGFVPALVSTSDRSSHLTRICGVTSLPELDKMRIDVTEDRLSAVREIAQSQGWRAASASDPQATLLCQESSEHLSPAAWMGVYCSTTERPLINLTPHDVTICDAHGRAERAYPSAGVARARQEDQVIGEIYGVPVVRSSFGEPQGFPDSVHDPKDPTVFVVSKITADAAIAAGIDPVKLVLTSGTVLDENRQIIGVRQFATAPKSRTAQEDRSSSYDVPKDAVLVNMTPRDLVLADPETKVEILTIPASGKQAMATTTDTPVGLLHGQQLTEVTYGSVENLPDPQPGVLYIVSVIAASAAPERTDLLLTSRPIRNEAGQIVAAGAFARP
jgi:hypothetical protein